MSNQEEEKLIKEANAKLGRDPFFEAPDGKILATGDSFRGPYTGITSDLDLDNPGQSRLKKKEVWE